MIRYIAPIKDPDDNLDYGLSYASWLADGDSVASATVSASPTGLTLGTKTVTPTSVIQWLSGGDDDTEYTLTIQATTAGGRTKTGYIVIPVRE